MKLSVGCVRHFDRLDNKELSSPHSSNESIHGLCLAIQTPFTNLPALWRTNLNKKSPFQSPQIESQWEDWDSGGDGHRFRDWRGKSLISPPSNPLSKSFPIWPNLATEDLFVGRAGRIKEGERVSSVANLKERERLTQCRHSHALKCVCACCLEEEIYVRKVELFRQKVTWDSTTQANSDSLWAWAIDCLLRQKKNQLLAPRPLFLPHSDATEGREKV